jgi:Protein of unknown function (DUF2887)
MLACRSEYQYTIFLMETDSFFYQLLKLLPETLFALLGQPLTRVADYRFDALEVKNWKQTIPIRNGWPSLFFRIGRRSRNG